MGNVCARFCRRETAMHSPLVQSCSSRNDPTNSLYRACSSRRSPARYRRALCVNGGAIYSVLGFPLLFSRPRCCCGLTATSGMPHANHASASGPGSLTVCRSRYPFCSHTLRNTHAPYALPALPRIRRRSAASSGSRATVARSERLRQG